MNKRNDCPLGGDITNDCADCFYSWEYHYDPQTGECVLRTPQNVMEERKKKIEEMAKIMLVSMQVPDNINSAVKAEEVNKAYYLVVLNYATHLYNAGCRKLPKDSVVLSRKEYEKLNMKYISALEQLENKGKETAEKFAKGLIKIIKEKDTYLDWDDVLEFAKEQFGIEIKEN